MTLEERIGQLEKEVAEIKVELEPRPINIQFHVSCKNPKDIKDEMHILVVGILSESESAYLVGKNV